MHIKKGRLLNPSRGNTVPAGPRTARPTNRFWYTAENHATVTAILHKFSENQITKFCKKTWTTVFGHGHHCDY